MHSRSSYICQIENIYFTFISQLREAFEIKNTGAFRIFMEKQEQDKLQIERLKEDNQNLQEVNLYIM